jgi:hypothetical protein
MIVREKRTGEEYQLELKLELRPPFLLPQPPDNWEFQEQPFGLRNKNTGEVRYPPPESKWCIHLPELEEMDYMPTSNLARRHTGNWNHVRPGEDNDYQFIPENAAERQTLKENGFTIT